MSGKPLNAQTIIQFDIGKIVKGTNSESQRNFCRILTNQLTGNRNSDFSLILYDVDISK